MQHCDDRSRAYPRAHKQKWRIALLEDEGAARGSDVELIANVQGGVEIAACDAVVLALDGDAVVAGGGRSAERVVAQHRLLCVDRDPKRQVLARTGSGEVTAVGILEPDRHDRVALARDVGHAKLPESCPSGRRAGRGETSVAAPFPGCEQSLERGLPAGTQSRNPQCPQELLARVAWEVE